MSDYRAGFATAAQLCRALPASASAHQAAAVIASVSAQARARVTAPDAQAQHLLHDAEPFQFSRDPYGGYLS